MIPHWSSVPLPVTDILRWLSELALSRVVLALSWVALTWCWVTDLVLGSTDLVLGAWARLRLLSLRFSQWRPIVRLHHRGSKSG